MKITGLCTTTPQSWKFKGFHFVRCTSSNDPPLSMAFAYNNPHNSNKVCRWRVLLGPCAGGESEARPRRGEVNQQAGFLRTPFKSPLTECLPCTRHDSPAMLTNNPCYCSLSDRPRLACLRTGRGFSDNLRAEHTARNLQSWEDQSPWDDTQCLRVVGFLCRMKGSFWLVHKHKAHSGARHCASPALSHWVLTTLKI